MKKLIKRLVESILFNDDDDFEDSEVSVMSTLMDPYEVTRHFNGMNDSGKRNQQFRAILNSFTSWQQLYDASVSEQGIEVPFVDFSLYEDNISNLTAVLDELAEHNIKIKIRGITIVLDNTKDVYYNIKDLIDFDKYNDILTCDYFVVRLGKLRNCEGFPKFVETEIVFDWIFGLESMEGFPETKYYPQVIFEFSPFPKSWKGFPSCVQMLKLENKTLEKRRSTYSRYEYTEEMKNEDLPDILLHLGTFQDFPEDFHTDRNIPGQAYDFHGVDIVSDYWPTGLKKLVRDYIGACLKKQYPKSGKLKNILCKSKMNEA